MKRTISVLLVVAMVLVSVLAMIPVSAAVTYDEINSVDDFKTMDPTKSYKLMADITIDETYAGGNFKGNFDGNNKTITLGGTALGVFGDFEGGEVKNLTIAGDIVTESSTDAGGLFRWGWGTFTNITNNANITYSFDAKIAQAKIGGIAGLVKQASTFTNCKNNGTISIDTNGEQQEHYAGGIFGRYEGAAGALIKLDGCVNNAPISDDAAGAYIGGMAGSVANCRFEAYNCVNDTNGDMSITQSNTLSNKDGAYTAAAGIIGGTYQGGGNSGLSVILSNCTNKGDIVAFETPGFTLNCMYTGGMIGRALHNSVFRATNCHNTGKVTGVMTDGGWTGAGGIVGCFMTIGMSWAGTNKAGVTIVEGCTNTGAIEGKNAGGMWGSVYQMYLEDQEIRLQYCQNSGTVVGKDTAGGMVGLMSSAESTASNISYIGCKNTGAVTADNIAAGIVAKIEKIGKKNIPVIESCANTGAIKTNGTSATAGIDTAAGIVGVVPSTMHEYNGGWAQNNHGLITSGTAIVSIKNCVSTGALVKTGDNATVNVDAISPAPSDNISAEGNTYKTGLNVVNTYGTATAEANCNSTIDGMKFSVVNVSALDSKVKDAKAERIESDYEEAAWSAFESAITAADALLADYIEATEQDVASATTTLDNAITALENALKPITEVKATLEAKLQEAKGKEADSDKYTGLSWNKVAQAIEDAEAVIANGDRISQFTVATTALTSAIEGLKEKPTSSDDPTTTPDDPTTDPDATTDGDSTGDASGDSSETDAAKKKGCGSAIAATAVVLSTVLALGAGVAFKKKED